MRFLNLDVQSLTIVSFDFQKLKIMINFQLNLLNLRLTQVEERWNNDLTNPLVSFAIRQLSWSSVSSPEFIIAHSAFTGLLVSQNKRSFYLVQTVLIENIDF